jgi:tRNA 2-thiouridine synthesizing protein A
MAIHQLWLKSMTHEMTNESVRTVAKLWDAGETGCGALIMGLKREIGNIGPGELLQVTALDAGAPADLPAWCRVTGHMLVEANHPAYVLKKKGQLIQP